MRYFKEEELKCKCGCGLYIFNEIHLITLNQIRDIVGIPLIVTSGTRCSKHNVDEGGSFDSDHLTGQGTDIKCIASNTRWKIIRACYAVGVKRIGIGKIFIHIGTNENNPQEVLWLY